MSATRRTQGSLLGASKFAKGAASQDLDRMTFNLFWKLGKNLGVIGVEVQRQDVPPGFVLLNPDAANPRLVQQAERMPSFQLLNLLLSGHDALLLEQRRFYASFTRRARKTSRR